MAGSVGGGGLGDIAIRYGHQRGITSVMWVTVVILIVLVQIVQSFFSWLTKKIDKRQRTDQSADLLRFSSSRILPTQNNRFSKSAFIACPVGSDTPSVHKRRVPASV